MEDAAKAAERPMAAASTAAERFLGELACACGFFASAAISALRWMMYRSIGDRPLLPVLGALPPL